MAEDDKDIIITEATVETLKDWLRDKDSLDADVEGEALARILEDGPGPVTSENNGGSR